MPRGRTSQPNPGWMSDALRRVKGIMGKNDKASSKGGGRSKSMPFIECTPLDQNQNKETRKGNLKGIVEEGDENRAMSPERTKSPERANRKREQSPRRKYKGPAGPGLMGKLCRNSAPAFDLSPPEPIVVEFVAKYVNQLKAVPFSLSEKMSRWCKRSPMALIHSHRPPKDHALPFPTQPYEDLMCDEFGRNVDTLAREAKDGPVGPRDELVLKMYPPGRHGVLNTFDKIPAGLVAAPAPRPSTPRGLSKPPPVYTEGSNVRREINNNSSGMKSPMSPDPTEDRNDEDDEAEEPEEIDEMLSPLSGKTRQINRAGARPAPMKRVATNISIIPQRTRSNLDDKMIAEMADRLNAAVY